MDSEGASGGSFLEKLKDGYEDLMAQLEEKGIPSPRVIFPALLIIVIILAAYFLLPQLTARSQTLSLAIKTADGNPIPNIAVTLLDGEKEIGTAESSGKGIVTFKGVPASADLKVAISDPNKIYADVTESITLSTTEIKLSQILDAGKSDKLFNVYVTDAGGLYIASAAVRLQLDDGTSLTRASDYSGLATFTFPDAPEHATLIISDSNYKELQKSLLKSDIEKEVYIAQLESNEEADAKDKEGEEPINSKYGSIRITLTSESGAQLEAIRVALLDAVSFKIVQAASTDAAGRVLFEDVLIGKEYAIEVKESAKYLAAETGQFELSSSGDVLEESIELTEKVDGDYIDLLIASDTGTISGAQIFLFDLEGKLVPKKYVSGTDGKANILVNKEKEYYVTAYATGYLPASITASASTQQQKITLVKQTDENSADLEITVLEDGEPAENSEVALFKSDGFFLGIPASSTDYDGKATFKIPREIEGSPYKLLATASREASTGTSAIISSDGVENLLINLISAPANIDVVLVDAITKAKLGSGKVTAQTDAGGMLGECDIVDGRCAISNIPSNVEFFLIGLSPKYLKTTSDHYVLSPKELRQIQLNLVSEKDATSVSAAFIGIFKSGEEVKELGNGETYYAKFIATFPSAAEIAGFHVHISPTNGMVNLLQVDSSAQSLFTSSKYSADACYLSTEGNGTINSIDLVFPKGTAGTKEISIKFLVAHDATASSPVTFFYKAYSEKKGVVISYPESDDLLVEGTVEPIDLVMRICKNPNKEVQIPVTDTPLICNADGSFCRKVALKASSTDIPLGTEFAVNFEVLSEEPITGLSVINSNLLMESATAGTGLADEPAVTQQAGEQSAEIAVPSNIRTPGTIKLKAVKAGTTELLINFNTENHVYPFRQNIRISGENIMRAAISPTIFNVGEEKRPRVSVYDSSDNPIPDAIVTLSDCDRAPLSASDHVVAGSGERGFGMDGIYQFELTPSTTGKIGLRVAHPDYRTIDRCDISVEITDDALRVSPQSLQFTGDSSSTIEEKSVTITSSFTDNSGLSIISTCGNQDTPVIYAFPNNVQNFKGSSEIKIGVLPDVSATTNCQLIFEQAITSRSTIRASIPVRVDVQSSRVSDLEGADFASIPSVIYLPLDENGFADVMYSTSNLGEVSFCDIQAKDDFLVTADCASNLIHLSADYSAESLNNTFRQRGKLQIRTSDQLLRTFSIIVTAPDAPVRDPSTKIIRYNNLPVLPNPITLYLDPYTRRFDNYYSLGIFDEPVIGCAIQDAEYGITTEFCGPEEQRIHVVADFTGYDIYNRLLQRVYGSNPACLLYYQQQGGFSQGGFSNQYYAGNSMYGSSSYYPYNQFGSSPYYPQRYSSIDQTGFGAYPVPQYQNGFVDYRNYPQMNGLQSPYPYPQPYYGQNNLNYDYSLSQIYANPSLDSSYSWDRCNAASFDVPLLITLRSGRTRTVPIRIMARGMPRTQQQRFQTANSEEWDPQEIQLDPYTLSRYVSYDVPLSQQTNLGFPQCKIASDSSFFKQVTENTQISAGQQMMPSKTGKFGDAVKFTCTESSGSMKVEGIADGSKVSASSKSASGALNEKSDLYLDIYYPAGVHKLAPIILKMGEVSEYTLEPLSGNLQFIVTDAKHEFDAQFKDTGSIFTEDTCAISGFDNAAAETGPLGDFQSKVMMGAEFPVKKYSFIDGKYAEAAEGTKDTIPLAKVPDADGTLSCKAKKSAVNAKLHVASLRSSYDYSLTGYTLTASIAPEMGVLYQPDAGKRFGCEVSSKSFSKSFSEKEKEGADLCTIFEGKISLSVNFEEILTAEELASSQSTGIKDTLTLKLSSITDNPKSRLKQKEISRSLAEIRILLNSKGTQDADLPLKNYRYSIASDSVCFGASRPGWTHEGIDLIGDKDPDGKEISVYVPFAGEVVFAGPRASCSGNTVIVEHLEAGKQFYSVYGHLKQISSGIAIGKMLSKGALIGLVGQTAGEKCVQTDDYKIGYHLHFQTCTAYEGDILSGCFDPQDVGIRPQPPENAPDGCDICMSPNLAGEPGQDAACKGVVVAPVVEQTPEIRSACDSLIAGKQKAIGIVLTLDDGKKLQVSEICIPKQENVPDDQRVFQPKDRLSVKYSVPEGYKAGSIPDNLEIKFVDDAAKGVVYSNKLEIKVPGEELVFEVPEIRANARLYAHVNSQPSMEWDAYADVCSDLCGLITFNGPEKVAMLAECKAEGLTFLNGMQFSLKFNQGLSQAEIENLKVGTYCYKEETDFLEDLDPRSTFTFSTSGREAYHLKIGDWVTNAEYTYWNADQECDEIYVKLFSQGKLKLTPEQTQFKKCDVIT